MKEINRREFVGYSAIATAALAGGTVFSAVASAQDNIAMDDPNAAALRALHNSPYATAAMPSMFCPVVDATGLEQY